MEEFSIMENNPPIWYNYRYNSRCHRHEALYGVRNRQKSIDDGLVVFMPPELHNASKMGVHFNKDLDLELKRKAQKRWQEYYNKTTEEFIKRYGRNYLP